mmetsp:Transcript_27846/g.83201  ORF Transcript_27846/g.83201 Transcript_27846/m.83201 type:complete len:212 (+) Transcript_27846:528-1163(+)
MPSTSSATSARAAASTSWTASSGVLCSLAMRPPARPGRRRHARRCSAASRHSPSARQRRHPAKARAAAAVVQWSSASTSWRLSPTACRKQSGAWSASASCASAQTSAWSRATRMWSCSTRWRTTTRQPTSPASRSCLRRRSPLCVPLWPAALLRSRSSAAWSRARRSGVRAGQRRMRSAARTSCLLPSARCGTSRGSAGSLPPWRRERPPT